MPNELKPSSGHILETLLCVGVCGELWGLRVVFRRELCLAELCVADGLSASVLHGVCPNPYTALFPLFLLSASPSVLIVAKQSCISLACAMLLAKP